MLVSAVCVVAVTGYAAMVGSGSVFGKTAADSGGDLQRSSGRAPATRLISALDGSDGRSSLPVGEPELGEHERLVATARTPKHGVRIYGKHGDPKPTGRDARKVRRVVERRRGQEGPLVFSVLKRRGKWLKALLPVRPNGTNGWIRERDVSLSVTNWQVRIELRRHRVTVRKDGEVFKRWPIGLGQPNTPTPTGTYYVTELIEPPEPDTIYGAYVFVLSGFSEKLTSYAGGNGELGLHGTNDPSGLGQDVSHGCIRMSNGGVTRLAERLPLGTPVTIER